ncbi:unnamed protein product, partial [Didymodactylos carnosus]
MQIALGQE